MQLSSQMDPPDEDGAHALRTLPGSCPPVPGWAWPDPPARVVQMNFCPRTPDGLIMGWRFLRLYNEWVIKSVLSVWFITLPFLVAVATNLASVAPPGGPSWQRRVMTFHLLHHGK